MSGCGGRVGRIDGWVAVYMSLTSSAEQIHSYDVE